MAFHRPGFKQLQIPALEMLILGEIWVPKDGSAGMVYSVTTSKTSGFYSQRLAPSAKPGILGILFKGTDSSPASPNRADPSSGMVLKFLGPWKVQKSFGHP